MPLEVDDDVSEAVTDTVEVTVDEAETVLLLVALSEVVTVDVTECVADTVCVTVWLQETEPLALDEVDGVNEGVRVKVDV